MKKTKKISKVLITLAFFIVNSYFLLLPVRVSADVPTDASTICEKQGIGCTKKYYYACNKIRRVGLLGIPYVDVCVKIIPDPDNKGCTKDINCVTGKSIVFGNATYATNGMKTKDANGDPISPATENKCTSDSRIENFCPDIANCNTSIPPFEEDGVTANVSNTACIDSVYSLYDGKMKDILQAEIDGMIGKNGLDVDAANSAIEKCNMNLTCINAILTNLKKNGDALPGSSASSSSTSSASEPLTAASLSDLINNSQNANTGPINSASNDMGGLLGKQPGPKVDVTFNSTGTSQAGAKMSATAVPSFFSGASDPKKLYFTWYLKRKGCGLTNGKDPGDVGACDMDGDGKITENDWKITAAKIIVAKGFDKTSADYTKFPTGIDEKTAGYEALPAISKKINGTQIGWVNDTLRKSDGTLYTENDTSSDVANCYAQAPKSGRVYEIRRAAPTFENECPTGYHRSCVTDQTATCGILNPAYDQKTALETEDAIKSATDWNADPANKNNLKVVPPAYAILKKITDKFNACAVSNENTKTSKDEINNKDVLCSFKDDTALKNFKANITCEAIKDSSGKDIIPNALCVKDDLNMEFKNNAKRVLGVVVGTTLGTTVGRDDTMNNKMCTAVANPDPVNDVPADRYFLGGVNNNPFLSNENCADLTDGLINGTKTTNGGVEIVGNPSLAPTCSFEKDVNLCKHLFPVLPKDVKTGGEFDVTGDGKFTLAEKQFWGADPSKASTNSAGKDEENVVGLGVETFDWTYTIGDQIGVVVEGESSIPSGHVDDAAKNQIMWAFSKGTCKTLEDMEKSETSGINVDNPDKSKRGFYLDGGKNVDCTEIPMPKTCNGILTADVDLNKCLEENLLEPTAQEGNTAGLSVQLNASPENPINDPNGKGDTLEIVSSAANSQESSGLLYEWKIQKSLDGSSAPIDTTSWIDITKKTGVDYPGWSGYSFGEVGSDGLGKKDFSLDLDLPEKLITEGITPNKYTGIFYLKIKVKIIGTSADGGQNALGETLPIRIKQQQNEMHVYPVTATDAGMVNMNKGIVGAPLEFCSDAPGKTTCYVTKNQLIGLEVPESSALNKLSNFSWKVNGNAMLCNANISSECSLPNSNKLFMPVLGSEGEAVDVVATAWNEKKESIEVSRHFVIGGSKLQITSANPSSPCSQTCLDNNDVCAKYLGRYVNENRNDCSTQVWETSVGRTVKLAANGQTGFDWAIDGQIIPEYKDMQQVDLVINKSVGESYNIGISTHLLPGSSTQLNKINRALSRNWGVVPEEVAEENQSANIQLDVVGAGGQAVSVAKSTFFGASLITHLPEQLMFLFKISLTSILLFFLTGLLFAFIPERIFREEK